MVSGKSSYWLRVGSKGSTLGLPSGISSVLRKPAAAGNHGPGGDDAAGLEPGRRGRAGAILAGSQRANAGQERRWPGRISVVLQGQGEELAAVYQRLLRAGISCYSEPQGLELLKYGRIRAVVFEDPDGQPIELVQLPSGNEIPSVREAASAQRPKSVLRVESEALQVFHAYSRDYSPHLLVSAMRARPSGRLDEDLVAVDLDRIGLDRLARG